MFSLISLPYASLAPVISDQTLSFHHGKHLQGYVDNLNKLLPGSGLEGKSLEDIIVISSGSSVISGSSHLIPGLTGNLKAIFNNAGQILNHNLYFTQFKTPDQVRGEETVPHAEETVPHAEGTVPHAEGTVPHAGLDPASPLLLQIAKQWGTLEAFQAEFEAKGVSLFGSGWVWLAAKADGELVILQCPGADNPVAHGLRPILTFDVWEHAYYLDFQNRRAAHLHTLWQILDWSILEESYKK